MVRSKLFVVLAFVVAAVTTIILGCGGSGGGGGSTGNNGVSGATFSISWPAVSRSYTVTLSSARSATITLPGGSPTGTDVSFDVDRDATKLAAYTATYTVPFNISASVGSMTATFYAQTGSTGAVVGSATAMANLAGTSLSFTPITLVGVIKTVAVATTSLTVGTSGNQLAATAFDASNTSVAVAPGAFTFAVVGGSSFLTLTTDGIATGVAVGNATVTATVDGLTSPAATISVVAQRPPVAPPPVCGSVVRRATVAAPDQNYGPNVVVPVSSTLENGLTPGHFRTFNYILNNPRGPLSNTPQGLTPNQVTTRYGVPANAGAGAIAVVISGDYPTALADFNTFSSAFGLPTEPSSNPTATNSQFQVVYVSGTQPVVDTTWPTEGALDTQWTHAMAPGAKIYLVECVDNTHLTDGVNIAKALPGVTQVSMSWGSAEDACSLANFDSFFLQQGVTFFASSGDLAGLRWWPATSDNVIAVGATTWNKTAGAYNGSESVWSKSGCGQSAFEPRPVSQDGVYSIVGLYREAPDICAVGDPNTGVSVFCNTPTTGSSLGWIIEGGTSASCPIVAGMANASGSVVSGTAQLAANLYSNLGLSSIYDVTTGTDSTFAAGTGFDLATGLGTPRGTACFFPSGTPARVSARRRR